MRVKVKVRTCDRCPINHQRHATVVMSFGLGESRWHIELCEDHATELERVIDSWGRLGVQDEDQPAKASMFGESYLTDAKRVAELRTRQNVEDAQARIAFIGNMVREGARTPDWKATVPPDATDWKFTDHAKERLTERNVDIISVLWAASKPTRIQPGRQTGLEVHTYNGVKAVVNPETKTVITCANLETKDESA